MVNGPGVCVRWEGKAGAAVFVLRRRPLGRGGGVLAAERGMAGRGEASEMAAA